MTDAARTTPARITGPLLAALAVAVQSVVLMALLLIRVDFTAEYVALWFKSVGMESGFYWYVTACIACSLLVYATMKDTKQHSRITTD